MTVLDSALSLRVLEGRTGDSNNPWMALIENNLIDSCGDLYKTNNRRDTIIAGQSDAVESSASGPS